MNLRLSSIWREISGHGLGGEYSQGQLIRLVLSTSSEASDCSYDLRREGVEATVNEYYKAILVWSEGCHVEALRSKGEEERRA